MATKLIVRGQPEPSAVREPGVRGKAAVPQEKPTTDLLTGVRELAAFSLSPSARARGEEKPVSLEVRDDDVLEIKLEGG